MMLMLMLSNLVLHVFVPLSSFNADVLLHIHALYACTCVLAVYVYCCVFIYFLFLDCISFFITCLFNSAFFPFRFGYNNNNYYYCYKNERKLEFLPFTQSRFFFSVDRNTHTYCIQFRYSYNK